MFACIVQANAAQVTFSHSIIKKNTSPEQIEVHPYANALTFLSPGTGNR